MDQGLTQEAHSIGVQVADVRFIPAEGESPFQCAAILEEIVDGPVGVTPRRLPLWIGSFEGEMLALALERVALPRPYIYLLTSNLLQASGARVREVHIAPLDARVFRAEITIETPTGMATVDARPSDALNLALLAGAPITAAASLFAGRAAQEAAEPERRAGEWAMLTSATSHGAIEVAARIRAIYPA